MNFESIIKNSIIGALHDIYNQEVTDGAIQIQKTRKEFRGDFTVVMFPLLSLTKQPPEITGKKIGEHIRENVREVSEFNVIKGFLNLTIEPRFWIEFLNNACSDKDFGKNKPEDEPLTYMIEYSSPNTNKPLHLGHIRNNLIGFSIAEIIKANGNNVIKVNLVNDRGIHICKSMLAWKKWGKNETPDSTGQKGDKLVGDYYVIFENKYKQEVRALEKKNVDKDTAMRTAPVLVEAQELLRRWESGDKETIALWEKMNRWVYDGFDETYKKLGVDFDKIYYESDTYKFGRSIVLKGLEDGILTREQDGSVWADISAEGFDKKLLLRSDGTSVYMTQDIGTANQRFEEYDIDNHIYVVGNEQNYHFQVLSIILKKLGYDWADNLFHLSYGMVELPEGKMKSREGKVVDADDLIEEMINTARDTAKELGKLDEYDEGEKENIYRIIGMGALKYFILKVDPRKNMTFDPKESIDLNGNTGPFIQYTYARIQSVLKNARQQKITVPDKISVSAPVNDKEIELIKLIYEYPLIVSEAGQELSPALIANYVYELAKEYNQFYHDLSILKEENKDIRELRILLSIQTGNTIRSAMQLLGIEVPDRM